MRLTSEIYASKNNNYTELKSGTFVLYPVNPCNSDSHTDYTVYKSIGENRSRYVKTYVCDKISGQENTEVPKTVKCSFRTDKEISFLKLLFEIFLASYLKDPVSDFLKFYLSFSFSNLS